VKEEGKRGLSPSSSEKQNSASYAALVTFANIESHF